MKINNVKKTIPVNILGNVFEVPVDNILDLIAHLSDEDWVYFTIDHDGEVKLYDGQPKTDSEWWYSPVGVEGITLDKLDVSWDNHSVNGESFRDAYRKKFAGSVREMIASA